MKLLMFVLLTLTPALNACSPFVIVSSSGEQPTPVVETEPAVSDEIPAPVIEGTYQLVQVDDVTVEVGVGSPVPVHANIGAQLPDQCGQVEYVEQNRTARTSSSSCTP